MIRKVSDEVDGGSAVGKVVILCLILAALTFAVFGQTSGFAFLNYDDNVFVYENKAVTSGLSPNNVAWAFTHREGFFYNPLTLLSLMGDYQLHQLRAGGYHLTNVLLHTASVILLFLLLRRMTGALWRSAFVAAVFAIHPLRAESVAWVAERKDVLSGLFFVLTIGAYVRFVRKPRSWGRYALVVLLFALGLLSKPMLVTLPLVLLLLDYWPLKRTESVARLALEKLPLLALSAAACGETIWAQSPGIQSTEFYSMPLRLGNALAACAIYLRQMIWPADLAAFYPYPRAGLPLWEWALAGGVLVGISIFAWKLRKKQPWLLMGWLWYLVMLLPVLGILQVGTQAHADRYTYLPQIGICIALTWLVAEWCERMHVNRAVIGAGMGCVIGVLTLCAIKQTGYWENGRTLWTHALLCTRDNYAAHFYMGNELRTEGDTPSAVQEFQRALSIKPDYAEAHNNLGNALRAEGKMESALSEYERALQLNPANAKARNNLGYVFLQQGKLAEAVAQFQQALKINPDDSTAQANLAQARRQQQGVQR